MAKVLIVDDSPSAVFKLKKLVENWGHETLTAGDGEQAIDLARREQPGVILMDIIMPGMNGYQATRCLGRDQETNAIPVIFVSNRDAESDRIWGLRQGAIAYITKPVEPDVLFNAISGAVAA